MHNASVPFKGKAKAIGVGFKYKGVKNKTDEW